MGNIVEDAKKKKDFLVKKNLSWIKNNYFCILKGKKNILRGNKDIEARKITIIKYVTF